MSLFKLLGLTVLALIAFAANSVLCRLALGEQAIDPASFTVVRLVSGAITLLLIIAVTHKANITSAIREHGKISSSLALFVYAAGFSFAYVSLDTATGALVLFASVQLSMLLINLFCGVRLNLFAWIGTIMAFCGFVYLIFPGLQSPNLFATILMIIAGVAWGVYSILGKSSRDATASTAANFIFTLPFLLPLLFLADLFSSSSHGILLAVASGALASGVGYAIWYQALPHLKPELASICQLFVPVIAAVGGILFVNEPITIRLVTASLIILIGIGLVIFAPKLRARM